MAGSTPTNRTVNIFINQASAEKAFQNLQKQSDKLTDSIAKGQKAGKDMTGEIEKLAQTKAKLDQLDGVISGKMAPSLSQVKARAFELRRELEKMSEDAPGYAAKFEEFKQVSARFQEMQADVRGVGKAMEETRSKGSSFLETIKGVALGTIIGNTVQAATDSISGYFSSLVSGNAKLSDSLADIRKATGLTVPEVEKLNTALSKIDTRTSHEELRRIAVGLGQIGEAATPETVAAIDKIVVALGDEFGGGAQEITTVLGTLRNNLQDIKTGNYAEDMLHLGNALNELGAQGLATAPVVVDFANRLAGIAGTFGATSGQILGLSATLQELGVPAERGATAITKLLQKITGDTDKYAQVAKYAGVSAKDFVHLVNTDILAALTKLAEGARKAGADNQTFGKILSDLDADGSGTGEVLSKLAKNADLLSNKISLASTTLKQSSSITAEFDGKNNNLAATIEKVGKKLSSYFTNGAVLAGLKGIISGFAELIGAIDHSNDALKAFNEQQQQLEDIEKKIVPLLQRYDELRNKAKELGDTTKLSKDEQVELRKSIDSIATAIPGAVTEFDRYGKAVDISTDRVRDFIRVNKLALLELNRDRIEQSQKTIGSLQQEMDGLQDAIPHLRAELAEALLNEHDPKKIAAYNREYSKTITGAEKEVILLRDRIAGQRELQAQWQGTTTALAAGMSEGEQALKVQERTIEILKQRGAANEVIAAQERKLAEMRGEAVASTNPAAASGYKSPLSQSEINKQDAAKEALIRFQEKLKKYQEDADAAAESNDAKEIQRVRDKYQELNNEADAYFRKYGQHIAEAAGLSKAEQKELEALYKKQFEKRSDKEYESSLQSLKDFYNKEKQEAGYNYAAGLLDKHAYGEKIKQLDRDEVRDRATISTDYAGNSKKAAKDAEDDKTQAVADGIADRERLEQKVGQDKIYDAERAVVTAKRGSRAELDAKEQLLIEQFNMETAHMDKTSAAYKEKDAKLHRELLDLEKEFNRQRSALAADIAGQMAGIAGTYFNYLNQRDETELANDQGRNNKEKANLQKLLDAKRISQAQYNRDVQKLDDDYARKSAEIKHKEFVRNKALNIVNAIIATAQAVAQALTAGPILGPIMAGIVGAAGAVQIATIAAQKEPEYFETGGVAKGARHRDGGISMINADGQKVGEMEGGEAYMILSRETTRNNGPLINDLLDASVNGRGRPVRPQYLYQRPAPLNTARAQDNMQYIRIYSNGGIVNAAPAQQAAAGAAAAGGSAATDPELKAAIISLNQQLAAGISTNFVWTDFKKMQQQAESLQKAASLRAV